MTQPDIYDAVNFAVAQSGKRYQAYGDRFGLEKYDCSGLVIRSLDVAHIPLPSTISVGHYGNTVSLYNWAKDVGGIVPVSKGVATKGAIMIKGRWWGNGPLGHTSLSLGDGREMAAHGRRTGVGVGVLNAGFYQDAFIIPGVDYHIGPPPLTPEQIAALEKLKKQLDVWLVHVTAKTLRYNDRGEDVSILIWLLAAKGYLPPGTTGDRYGKPVWTAVNAFKKDHGWPRHTPSITGAWFGGAAATAILK